MKSFLNKILIVAVLALIMPFFSYATPAPEPTISCSPAYPSDLVGKDVTITAHVRNGTGTSYIYSWSGDDGLNAGPDLDLNEITRPYSQVGNMTINVIASSTDSSDYLTTTCSVNIYTLASLPDYTASCRPNTDRAVIGQDVTWEASVNGPLAPYSIVWTGTDGLTSSEFTYATSGYKTATMVSFESRYGSDTTTHNAKLSNVVCTPDIEGHAGLQLYVVPEEISNPTDLFVSGSCSASSATQYLNSTTTWNSSLIISGGVAPYTINWVDNEGSIGVGASVSKLYSATGTKNAGLIVRDSSAQEYELDCGSVSIDNTSTCTSWSYSDWGNCSEGNQTRSILSSSPTGCVGGSPVLSQSCSSGSRGSRGSYVVTTVSTDTTSTTTNDLNNNVDLVVPKPVAVITDTEDTLPNMVGANAGITTEDNFGLTGQEAAVLGALDGLSGTSTGNSFTASVFSAISGNIMYILGILILLGLIVWFLFWIKRRKENK